jgi:hypothetical protein
LQWEYFKTLPSANSKHFVSQSSEVHPGKNMIPIMHMYGIHTPDFSNHACIKLLWVYKKLYVPSAQDERVGDIITRRMQRAGHAVLIIVLLITSGKLRRTVLVDMLILCASMHIYSLGRSCLYTCSGPA